MPVKILSVDDEIDLELLLTQYFRRQIRKGEYEFKFAHNGLEALTMLLKEKDFDIILSDINMPEMDGLTLLTKINEMQNPALKCIMVSAYGDMGNIRQAMNNGAFDFATKPIDLDDLQLTIDKAVEQIEYIRSAQAEHNQLIDIQSDLSVAREIQHAILPRTFRLKMDDADKIKVWKVSRVLLPIAEKFDADSKDAAEKMKPSEDFNERLMNAQEYERVSKDASADASKLKMGAAEYGEFLRELQNYNKLVSDAVKG